MFEPYLKRWSLVPDGGPIATHSSNLLPVLSDGVPAMLKIAHSHEERRGADLMVWWAGDGAARDLVPLATWFAELPPAATKHRGILAQAAAAARDLLAAPQDIRVLHGDLHHGNVLDFGARGWHAIDPKGLVGERAFDFANIFCNPDLETATPPARLARQASVVAEVAHLDRARLLRWILAYAGLSAAWTIGEGGDARLALTVAEIAAVEIASSGS